MKIRGNTIGTTQSPVAALLAPTDMGEQQQAKARENIGAASAEEIGDIKSALDAIIAMQESIIGGESE